MKKKSSDSRFNENILDQFNSSAATLLRAFHCLSVYRQRHRPFKASASLGFWIQYGHTPEHCTDYTGNGVWNGIQKMPVRKECFSSLRFFLCIQVHTRGRGRVAVGERESFIRNYGP